MNTHFSLKYFKFGTHAISIQWPEEISEVTLCDILQFKNKIETSYPNAAIECVQGFSELVIYYHLDTIDLNDEIEFLKIQYDKRSPNNMRDKAQLWEIPVCYDLEYGKDLEAFSKAKQLPIEEVIRLHTETTYTIYFTGFLPGFLYLGGLPPQLFKDRKQTPNLNISKGSVGIGGKQTGIYPQQSPGGWHIIGKTPVSFFNSQHHPPSVFKSGDRLRFKAVDKASYLELETTRSRRPQLIKYQE